MLDQLGNELAEQREGWVGDHDVRLAEKLQTLGASEITVAVEW